MRNDTQIKVSCITNNQTTDEFHFDYYDKEGKIVGSVAVDEQGHMGWAIWNSDFENTILATASIIFGDKIENTIECILAGKEVDYLRWDNAQDFIASKGLIVNYMNNKAFNRIFQNGSGKYKR